MVLSSEFVWMWGNCERSVECWLGFLTAFLTGYCLPIQKIERRSQRKIELNENIEGKTVPRKHVQELGYTQ